MTSLTGKVAVVAGATRGAGRGIACALGEAGATVYCTGRSVRGRPASGPGRPETIEETAELVTRHGGTGRWVRVDHTVEAEVAQLFARVQAEAGGLDILVNDIWGGDDLTEWGHRCWELNLDHAHTMLERAVWAHIVTSRHGLSLLIERGTGLVVEITDGDAETNVTYRGHLMYDLVKSAAMRLAYAMSCELRATGVTALALSPGFLRSEAMLERLGVTEATWRDAIPKNPPFAESETPFLVGRAVVALASDPHVREKAGASLATWTLAEEYGLTDLDGRRPHMGRYLRQGLEERWGRILALVTDALRAEGLDPETDFSHDRWRLELRARLNPGREPARWFRWPVLVPDLWMEAAQPIAAGFVARYRTERAKRGAATALEDAAARRLR